MEFRLGYDFEIATDLFRLSFEEGKLPTAHLRQSPGQAVVVLPRGFDFSRSAAQAWGNKVLASVLREHARLLLPPRLAKWAAEYGLRYNRLLIKNVRTRWGSCSTLGNINLSLWLLLAPSHLVDYVIKHELAHLRQMNHGPEFWREVDRMTAGRGRALEREMKDFSRKLLARR